MATYADPFGAPASNPPSNISDKPRSEFKPKPRLQRDYHEATSTHFLDTRGQTSTPDCPNGQNPATVLEKPMRDRITTSMFYQDVCFGLNEASIVSRVVNEVRFVGGTYGSTQTPSPFICLTLRLLQLAPSDAILEEYLGFGGEKFKYLRAWALFYIRLTRKPKDVYLTLERFLDDRRKLRRRRGMEGKRELVFMDEFVDSMLVKERVCGTSLMKLPRRTDLEDLEVLDGPRVSGLGDVEEVLEGLESDGEGGGGDGDGARSDRDSRELGRGSREAGEESEEDEERRKRRKTRSTSRDSRSDDER